MSKLEDTKKKILDEGRTIKLGECRDIELETENGTVVAEVCRTGEKKLEVKKIK